MRSRFCRFSAFIAVLTIVVVTIIVSLIAAIAIMTVLHHIKKTIKLKVLPSEKRVKISELYLGLIHDSCVTSHFSSSQRVQLLIGII
jgi:hypothetical protein